MFLSFQILNKNFLFKAKYIFLIISLFHVYVNSTLAMLSEQIIITPRARHTTCLGSRVSLSPGVSSISSPSPPPHGQTHVAFTWLHALVITDGVDIAYLDTANVVTFTIYASPFHSLYGSHNAMKCRKTQKRPPSLIHFMFATCAEDHKAHSSRSS